MFTLLVEHFVCDMHITSQLNKVFIRLCLLIFSGNKDTEADSHPSKENSGTFSRVFYQS